MKKLDTLTGIRALAALWVAGFHFFTGTYTIFQLAHLQPAWLSLVWMKPLLIQGYLGVDLFFILSGFVLSLVHQNDFKDFIKKADVFRFLGLRLARIYPVMVSVLFLMVPIWLLFHQYGHNNHPGDYTFWGFLCSLLMIQSWGFCQSSVWNSPAWSVSAEWFIYLLFPFIAFGLSRVKHLGLNLLIAITSFTGLYYISEVVIHELPISGLPSLVRIGAEFIIGSCLYNIFSNHTLKPNGSDGIGLSILFLIPLILFINPANNDMLIVALFALLIFCLAIPGKFLKALFGNKTMVHLGEISYSFYLVHYLALSMAGLHVVEKVALKANGWLFFIIEILFLLLTLLAAECLYRWIEVPARRFIRNKILYKKKNIRSHNELFTEKIEFKPDIIQI